MAEKRFAMVALNVMIPAPLKRAIIFEAKQERRSVAAMLRLILERYYSGTPTGLRGITQPTEQKGK